ncbi:MAG: hypothetical protein SD837_15505 [Candidatus Electrothrix scaldis]|nr:MAG: hypothetical protein SD837_15505 [Candidatus Electrothrix sp. GW3-3]
MTPPFHFLKRFFLSFFLFFLFPSLSFSQEELPSCARYELHIQTLGGDRSTNTPHASDLDAQAACTADHGSPCPCSISNASPPDGSVVEYYYCYHRDNGDVYYPVCQNCADTIDASGVCDSGPDGRCDSCEEKAPCECANRGGVIWDDDDHTLCRYHCRDDEDCPDSDYDGLPDCCGGNLDCPDSDGDGIYDCCGDGGQCEDSDSDGTPDACDACPDDPSISEKEICSYEVSSYCDGVNNYNAGDVCGTWTTTCDGDGCRSNGDQYIQESGSQCDFACCEQVGCETVRCDVDPETCEPRTCDCPDGQDTCAECKDPDCTCDDGSDTCVECQLPEDGSGDPADGCECPNGEEACSQCQDPSCTCDDGSTDPCPECQYPPPSSSGGGGDGGDGGIPDSISIGGCMLDLTELKEFLSTDAAFPFNFLYAIQSFFSPFLSLSPETPVLHVDIDLPRGPFLYIPDSLNFVIDFSPLDFIAVLLRKVQMIIWAVIMFKYIIRRYDNVFGVA